MEVAKVLKWWIEKIEQTSEAFVSDTDISLGTRWSDVIKNALAETAIGVICVTPENQSAPWINFEAGAISKAVNGQDTKVIPVLIDFQKKTDYKGPLSDFNLALMDKDGLLKLAKAANSTLPKPKDDSAVLETFEILWPHLEEKLLKIDSEISSNVQPSRQPEDVMSEILDTVRDIQKQDRSGGLLASLGPNNLGRLSTATSVHQTLKDDRMRQQFLSRLLSDVNRYLQSISTRGSLAVSSENVLLVTTPAPLDDLQRTSVVEIMLNYNSVIKSVLFGDDPDVLDIPRKS